MLYDAIDSREDPAAVFCFVPDIRADAIVFDRMFYSGDMANLIKTHAWDHRWRINPEIILTRRRIIGEDLIFDSHRPPILTPKPKGSIGQNSPMCIGSDDIQQQFQSTPDLARCDGPGHEVVRQDGLVSRRRNGLSRIFGQSVDHISSEGLGLHIVAWRHGLRDSAYTTEYAHEKRIQKVTCSRWRHTAYQYQIGSFDFHLITGREAITRHTIDH